MRSSSPLCAVVDDTVLPGETRAVDATALGPAAMAWLASAPNETRLLLLPVTALAEAPLLAAGRYATRAAFLGLDPAGRPTFQGESRVRIVAAKGQTAPYDAEHDDGVTPDPGPLGELVWQAALALRRAPPIDSAVLAPVAGACLRALAGPAAARAALADGDLAAALSRATTVYSAESEGRAAGQTLEALAAELAKHQSTTLSKALRQRLWSAVVEITRRLDLYDTQRAKDDDLDELDLLRRKIDQAGLPTDARAVAERELRLLRSTKADHHDYPTHLRLLQLLGRLAWHPDPLPPIDLGKVQAALDADHAGLERPKRRILEFLAVRALGGEGRSTVLCLAGPPGTGKTTIAAAIAKALSRPFVRIALGGVHDQAELRGHRITYLASRPGRIIDALATVRSRSALVLLDELDKVGTDRSRDVTGALLEILDPEQNHAFSDHFLGVPYDLSDCLFIATANDLSRMPDFLKDRLEIIELDGYTAREKVTIAQHHLQPSLAREHGIPALDIPDRVIADVIEGYTREAGIRQLRRELAAFYRQRAVERLLPTPVTADSADTGPPDPGRPVAATDIVPMLGPRRFRAPKRLATPAPGVATGLSVSGYGGQLLPLEVVRLPPSDHKARVRMTGSLGAVMKESVDAVRAHVLAYSERYGVDPTVASWTLHLHAPEAAVPKDGPSAGVAIFCALVSLATGRPVRPDVAMTGELDLSGRVHAVGGIRAKCLAAERAGLAQVLVPRDNEGDVPPDLAITVVFIDRAEDLLPTLLPHPMPVPVPVPVPVPEDHAHDKPAPPRPY